MTYNPTNCPGPGDPCTWSPYAGHPNDPRAPDAPDYEELTDRGEKVRWLVANFSHEELADLLVEREGDEENFCAAVWWIVRGATHDDKVCEAIKEKAIYYGMRRA